MEADQRLDRIVDMGHGPPMPWALTHLAAEQCVYTCEPFPPSSDLLMHYEGTEEQYLNASRPDLVQAYRILVHADNGRLSLHTCCL